MHTGEYFEILANKVSQTTSNLGLKSTLLKHKFRLSIAKNGSKSKSLSTSEVPFHRGDIAAKTSRTELGKLLEQINDSSLIWNAEDIQRSAKIEL